MNRKKPAQLSTVTSRPRRDPSPRFLSLPFAVSLLLSFFFFAVQCSHSFSLLPTFRISGMGKFIWHDYARLTAITATICKSNALILFPNTQRLSDAVWASFFGLIYRKFFWDFVGGTLRDPGGLQCVYFLPQMLFI